MHLLTALVFGSLVLLPFISALTSSAAKYIKQYQIIWTVQTSLDLTFITECAAAAVVFGALIYYHGCVTLLRESVREHMAGEIKSSLW